ncbi:MAG: CPBP family intramembrane metalloprotease [Saprospiraceae bacterium]|nr:CPBP family intramembrane metalloprotease [Saprospiraceae bacterium]
MVMLITVGFFVHRYTMFFAAAKTGKNGILPFVMMLLLVMMGVSIGQLPLGMISAGVETTNPSSGAIEPNTLLLLLLMGFMGGFLFLRVAFPLVHRRPFRTLITEAPRVDSSRIALSFALWFLLVGCSDIVMYAMEPSNYVWQFRPKQFFPLLLIAVFALPIQTSLEEFVFRGYLMQQVGLVSKGPVVPILVTSVLFGAMHLANPEVHAFGVGRMMFYYVSFGILLAVSVVMDNRLEIALGMHAANNFYGATIVSFDNSALQTPSLFFQYNLDIGIMLLLYVILATVFFLILYKRYHWDYRVLLQRFRLNNDEVFSEHL